MTLRRFAASVAPVALAASILHAGGPGRERPATAAPESLPEVLDRFDRVQATIRTLSAQFVQTTTNSLLKQPTVARGEFFLTKPDAVLWEFVSPEPMRFCVAAGEYTGYFPERKRAERRDIKRWSEQLFRFFGLGQGSAELGRFYDIALGDPGSDMKGSYLLVLSPKKRRVKKNVEEVRLWVDAGNLLPVRIDYVGKDGGGREIRFANTRLNPDLSAGLYHVDIPKDVPVSNGFSGLDLAPTRSR